MLEKIFKYLYKDQQKYTDYINTDEKVIGVLKNRANLTSPSQVEIIDAINKVLDSKLVMKDQQKLIEKSLVTIRGHKEKMEYEIFMWKQEMKLRFEIDQKDYINEYKEELGKKSLTIEDKKMLFRNYYKKEYNMHNKQLTIINEYIETLENERNNILDTKRLLTEYLEILKRVNY